jgi:DNA helicase-2/ATP-dependent DNA helicase PcrA
MNKILTNLNEPQRAAVTQTEGPVMIIAGAGSGKTRVLTYRIAYLLEIGIDPFQILALTFTNKAAREMKNRIEQIVGADAKNLFMGTFHSVFARILRVEAAKIGYPAHFTIYDTDDAKSLLKSIIKEQGLDEKIYKPNLVLNRISSAKNNLFGYEDYYQNIELMHEDKQSGKPKLALLFELYSKRCFKSGAMDFDDLLFNTYKLLATFPEVLNKYQNKFKYVLVDEFQDTNWAQYKIVKKLSAQHENICVVGDDAQSIYAFRGANIQNILSFEKDYQHIKTFKLEQNYRSTQHIVNAANSVIAHNKTQLKKNVWTANESGEKIKMFRALSDNEEGSMIANEIFEDKMLNRNSNSDYAILYRTNAQSRSMEEGLRRLGIAYKIYGGISFYARKEIKDLLAYIKISINHNDEEALKRIINYPKREIGKTSIERILIAADTSGVPLWTVLENVNYYASDINTPTRSRITDFVMMVKSFSVISKTKNAYDAASHIANQSGLLRELYADKTPEGISHFENLQELLNGIKEFVDTGDLSVQAPILEKDENIDDNSEEVFNTQLDFETTTDSVPDAKPNRTIDMYMQDIALLTDADKNKDDGNTDVVSLMTIHASKGLEYKNVFVVGLEENLFPSMMAMQSRADLEEERRLFYVAMTRAEKKLFISYAISRYKFGNLMGCEPSRFLDEIDPEHTEVTFQKTRRINAEATNTSLLNKTGLNLRSSTKPTTTSTATTQALPTQFKKLINVTTNTPFVGDDTNQIVTGMEVEHEKFGRGKVIAMEGKFPDTKCTIFFSGVGNKQLLLKFAKLKIVG